MALFSRWRMVPSRLVKLLYIILVCKVWTSSCIGASTWHEVGNLFFATIAPSPTLSWQQAEDECGKINGTLAVARNDAAHQALETFRSTLPNKGDPMWIGLKAVNGQWTWSDGGLPVCPVDFNKWSPRTTPPVAKDDLCIAVKGDDVSGLTWTPMPCSFPLKFICTPEAVSLSPSIKAGVAATSVWRKKYPEFKYVKDQSKDGIHGVESAVHCAIIATTKNRTCNLFNYSNSSQHCVLLIGVSAISSTDMVKDKDWDLWKKESDPRRCP